MPDEDELPAFLTSAPADTTVIADVGERPRLRRRSFAQASYHRPVPRARLDRTFVRGRARCDTSRLEIWTHSQGVHMLRREIARALAIPQDGLVVRHVEGAGCYGHNGADDVAMDAAVLAARRTGPAGAGGVVATDELSWSPLGPAGVVRIAADCDADGDVLSWRHEIWRAASSAGPA